MRKVIIPLMICTIFCLVGCKSKKQAEETVFTSGIDLANLDTTVSPNEDFYQFACGGWMKNNPLKPEYSRYGSFDVLAENNQVQLKEIICEAASQQHEQGTVPQKIGDLYNIGMDTLTIEEQGVAEALDRIHFHDRGLPHLPRPDEQNRLRDRKPIPYFFFQMAGKIVHGNILVLKVACILCS